MQGELLLTTAQRGTKNKKINPDLPEKFLKWNISVMWKSFSFSKGFSKIISTIQFFLYASEGWYIYIYFLFVPSYDLSVNEWGSMSTVAVKSSHEESQFVPWNLFLPNQSDIALYKGNRLKLIKKKKKKRWPLGPMFLALTFGFLPTAVGRELQPKLLVLELLQAQHDRLLVYAGLPSPRYQPHAHHLLLHTPDQLCCAHGPRRRQGRSPNASFAYRCACVKIWFGTETWKSLDNH